MSIDWFTVIAQVVNFLVLAWLLKHFLYQPVLDAIDVREKRIATENTNAAQSQTDARAEKDKFQKSSNDLEKKRAELMSAAVSDAHAEQDRLRKEGQAALDGERNKSLEKIKNETLSLRNEISRRAQLEVFAMTRKVLSDLASVELENSLAEVFIRRLRQMDDPLSAKLNAALKMPGGYPKITSTFALPPEQRAIIQKAINQGFSAEVPLTFEVKPELIGGIELTAGGQKLAWSISDYLSSLQRGVEETWATQAKAHDSGATTPPSVPEKIAR